MGSGEVKEGLGLNRCSKIAIIRNKDIKIAVATNPKDMAFIDAPKLFHGVSLSSVAWDELGSELVYMFHGFGLSESNPFMVVQEKFAFLDSSFLAVYEGLFFSDQEAILIVSNDRVHLSKSPDSSIY